MTVWKEAALQAKIDPDTGPELVVYEEAGLPPERLIRMQIGMLENNAIEGTLPFRRESHDGAVTLRYSIAGRRRLRSALHAESLREEQWDGLIAAIASAVREGADYCIRETEYVLDPDWIWVRRDVRDVKLVAVPIVDFGSPERAWRQFQSLYDCMVEHGLPDRWRERLHPSRWERTTFSHRLWLEAAASSPVKERRPEPVESAYRESEQSRERLAPEEFSYRGNSVVGKAIRDDDDGETMRFSAPRMTTREWVRLIAATVCCIVFVWNPSLPAFLVACLGCVPLGVTLYRRYGRESEPATASQGSGLAEARTQEVCFDEPSPIVENRTEQGTLAERTVLLGGDAHETILLSAMEQAPAAMLEIAFEEGNRIETICLSASPLRLGRGPAGVDVVVDHAAASRVHLEFEWSDGCVRACDLGSTNGTYYLDRAMTPHERYEVRDGDLLRLPGAVIRVMIGN